MLLLIVPRTPPPQCRIFSPSQEGSVDGTVVARHSAPSFFGFRRKDKSFELRADEDGLVVMRRGRPVWTIDAPELWRYL